MDTDGLEELVVVPARPELHHLVGEEADINDPPQPLPGIDHRNGQKLVQNEALARLEQGGALWQGEHPSHHRLADTLGEGLREELSGRNDAGEASVAINDIEVENSLRKPRRADRLKSLTDALVDP